MDIPPPMQPEVSPERRAHADRAAAASRRQPRALEDGTFDASDDTAALPQSFAPANSAELSRRGSATLANRRPLERHRPQMTPPSSGHSFALGDRSPPPRVHSEPPPTARVPAVAEQRSVPPQRTPTVVRPDAKHAASWSLPELRLPSPRGGRGRQPEVDPFASAAPVEHSYMDRVRGMRRHAPAPQSPQRALQDRAVADSEDMSESMSTNPFDSMSQAFNAGHGMHEGHDGMEGGDPAFEAHLQESEMESPTHQPHGFVDDLGGPLAGALAIGEQL